MSKVCVCVWAGGQEYRRSRAWLLKSKLHFKAEKLDATTCSVECSCRVPYQSYISNWWRSTLFCLAPVVSTSWPAPRSVLLGLALVQILPRRTPGGSTHFMCLTSEGGQLTDRQAWGWKGIKGVTLRESTDLFHNQNRLAQTVIHTNIYYLVLNYHQNPTTNDWHTFKWTPMNLLHPIIIHLLLYNRDGAFTVLMVIKASVFLMFKFCTS